MYQLYSEEMLTAKVKNTVILATAVILAVLLETIEPGASIGLCLTYTACLIITPRNTQNQEFYQSGSSVNNNANNDKLYSSALQISRLATNALFLTLPISMLHQRNLIASLALSLGLAIWLFRKENTCNKGVNADEKNKLTQRLKQTLKELRKYPYKYIALTSLLVFTLWAFFVQWVVNPLNMQQPLNLLATSAITIVWCVLCTRVKAPWTMVIPIIIGAWLSLGLLYITNTLDPIVARGLTAGENLLNIGPFNLTPMLSHKNNIATLATITLSILCFCLCKTHNHKKSENNNAIASKFQQSKLIPLLTVFFWANCLLVILTPSRIGLFSGVILTSLLLLNWTWVSEKAGLKKLLTSLTILLFAMATITSTELIKSSLFYKASKDPTEQYDISTGRLKIWQIAIDLQDNKMLGMGSNYWEKEGTPKMVAYNNFPAENTHNGFIEVFLAYGLIGLGLLLTAILTTAMHTIKWLKIRANELNPDTSNHNSSIIYNLPKVLIPSLILLLGTTLPMLTESYSWAWLGSPIISIWMGFCLSLGSNKNVKSVKNITLYNQEAYA